MFTRRFKKRVNRRTGKPNKGKPDWRNRDFIARQLAGWGTYLEDVRGELGGLLDVCPEPDPTKVWHTLRIGELLHATRLKVGWGAWLEWTTGEVGLDRPHANQFMDIYNAHHNNQRRKPNHA